MRDALPLPPCPCRSWESYHEGDPGRQWETLPSPEPFCAAQIAGPGQRPWPWHLQMVRLSTCSHPCPADGLHQLFTCCKGGHVQGRCVFSPGLLPFQVRVRKRRVHSALGRPVLDVVSFNYVLGKHTCTVRGAERGTHTPGLCVHIRTCT